MFRVLSFTRLNHMGPDERKEIILGEGYTYFQAYHDCLYCYDSIESVKYPNDRIYTIDENGTFILVKPDAE